MYSFSIAINTWVIYQYFNKGNILCKHLLFYQNIINAISVVFAISIITCNEMTKITNSIQCNVSKTI
jgi:hypothetical protein